ncbi:MULTISPECIES: GntR family transcriptional regulator [Rhodococcus]|uniref:GntR family transcriptional regulator n=1 Tax=Rhodococcus TaxID=1827 RepID=UPI0006BA598B|nr:MULTISPECIES: GntR family transcriptional regulator [Rhodococcus]KPH21580.1 GntR family transcriptional regulator [Rhodococcus sp. ADH]QXC46931.1 GntR family transcriptional regulator [Rhodococcus qingshengii]
MADEDRSIALNRSSAMPLWAQLHADLLRRIGEGEFVGTEFPGEHALTKSYGVSRHTTREALRHLRSDGMLIAERGRPSRLASPPVIEQPLGALYSLFAAVEATGVAQYSVVRALELRTDSAVAAILQLGPKAPLLYLERLRMAGTDPLALDRAWLPGELARELLDADFTHTALYIELEQRCDIRLTGGREDVTAVVPDPDDAAALELDSPTAALSIRRLGCMNSRPVELRHTLIRGDRFTVSATFSPSEGYRFVPADPLRAL